MTGKLLLAPTYLRIFMRFLLLLAATSLFAPPLAASTPAAWKQLQSQAERSCISASGFAGSKVSNMVVFDDAIGIVALLVSGTYRQRHMKGAAGTSLCLYNRKTRKAVVEEALGWGER
jgi:hypothetical protein